ncbi:uncharacterized protein PADG_00363 [Paracoccidioides brasiliensis Pb18]|uniref:Uncharacterized protein n=1 Tax=Paracoccidioides brasiliensis (strain Pb18) TaxID=502780 RepID=C1G0H3_PARBD|nr:uncharacterized protein PADG_00363 [Paracoccidioides brasiliensis Pb18]EEH44074.2 hypothetical protein PADG_00363 [Paracoccidioides brasiliensis Pb18]
MNRFRTHRKKTKDVPEDKDAQPLPLFTAKPFKRAKKPIIESKSELDLSSVLPSSDDFRTSLLMPNLSARFSMLREQDDPNSKIGKANDDSVLAPKRASRLNVFGQVNNSLFDIAEISSLHGSSARPSFAIGRGSYASGEGGYATDDDFSPGGSVMSRARPGEGNNLFGGRQKVYKIPVSTSTPRSGSASEASGVGGGMGGKQVYENDVTLSAFQKLRAKEKEQLSELELDIQQTKQDTEEDGSLASLPSGNRTSTSNTSVDSARRNSGQGTIASPPPKSKVPPNPISSTTTTGVECNPTKTRRYGQGIEVNTQQSSAFTRLESLSRQRAPANDNSPISRSLSKSSSVLNDKFQHRPPVYASLASGPTSPSPYASKPIMKPGDSARKHEPENPAIANLGFASLPPLSPPLSESEEQTSLEAALHPEDRGKATGMGLFNKPAAQYDEIKFSQRQLQMYGGRDTPTLRRCSPPSQPPPRVPDLETTGRSRQVSNASYRSKVDSLVSQFNGPQDEGERTREISTTPASSNRKPSPPRLIKGTFPSGSDRGGEDGAEPSLNNVLEAVQSFDNDNIHPAVRSSTDSNTQSSRTKGSHCDTPELRYSETRDLNTIDENESLEEPIGETPDSPTLGPSGLGLSGLVRTHLRHDSDTSMNCPPSPGLPLNILEATREVNPFARAARDANHASSVHSNPWEYDDLCKPESPEKKAANEPGLPDLSSMSMRAKQILGQATALRSQGHSSPQQKPDRHGLGDMRIKSPTESSSKSLPWQDGPKHGHQRDGSSDTQKEREELANELAERRRKVREKLKSFVESESGSSSPTLGHRFPDYGSSIHKHGNAFSMLKNKTGRNPMAGRHDVPQTKAMKMLGVDNAHSVSSPSLPLNETIRDDEDRFRDRGRESRSGSPLFGSRNHARPRQPQVSTMQRGSQDGSGESFHGEPSPSSHASSRRGRSGSDVSGRSKSQPRYRDDLGSVGENCSIQNDFTAEESKSPWVPTSVPSSSRPSEEVVDHMSSERAAFVASGRFRSNSRSAVQSHFDPTPPMPVQINQANFIGNPPRPSPVTPYSANTTPPLYETSPNLSSMPTPTLVPPMSNLNSPRIQGLNAHRRIIDKSIISEPKFVSSTSNVPTVGLPPGASLSNGSTTPPIPPMNPRRRRQTTTQTFLSAFKGSDYHRHDQSPMPYSNPTTPNIEQSIFSDEEKRPPRPRQRLRKISSEGGNLNAKARQQLMNSSSPALPQYPRKVPMEGAMF